MYSPLPSSTLFPYTTLFRSNNSVQYAERMEVYLDEAGDKILRTVSTGAVRIITRDCRTGTRSEEHTSELQSPCNLVCRLLLEKKKTKRNCKTNIYNIRRKRF